MQTACMGDSKQSGLNEAVFVIFCTFGRRRAPPEHRASVKTGDLGTTSYYRRDSVRRATITTSPTWASDVEQKPTPQARLAEMRKP
jgi:hypothetical protein